MNIQNNLNLYKPNSNRPKADATVPYECPVCGYVMNIPKNNGACFRCPQCFHKSCSG